MTIERRFEFTDWELLKSQQKFHAIACVLGELRLPCNKIKNLSSYPWKFF